MVPRRGVAPRSPAYRAGALLLSYGGMNSGGAPENRTLDAFTGRSGFRDRFLVYAGRAPLKLAPSHRLAR